MLVALEVASEEDGLDVSSRALTFASGVMMIHRSFRESAR